MKSQVYTFLVAAVLVIPTSGCHRAPALCASDAQCSGAGRCTNGRCACRDGYAGLGCELCQEGFHRDGAGCVVDEVCAPDSCAGHGACALLSGVSRCSCAPGYAGDRCERCDEQLGFHLSGQGDSCTADRCDPNPCLRSNERCEPSSGQCGCSFLACGESCCGAAEICFGQACCQPTQCRQLGKQCGIWSLGCGLSESCGVCDPAQTCLVSGACGSPIRLTPPEGKASLGFGGNLAIDRDDVIVGAPGTAGGDQKNLLYAGAAYVFHRQADGSWDRGTKLTPADPEAGRRFGISVAIQGENALVGVNPRVVIARDVYAFHRDGENRWDSGQKLARPEPIDSVYDSYGRTIALDGDLALVGAPFVGYPSTLPGTVYVFRRGADQRMGYSTKLVAADAATDDGCGWSVSIRGDLAAVGCNHVDGRGGSAYLYRRTGLDTWEQAAKLTPPEGAELQGFGGPVALGEGVIMVGSEQGVHVFQHVAGRWAQATVLVAPDPALAKGFGTLALYGDRAVVGAFMEPVVQGEKTLEGVGAIYVYRRTAEGQWIFSSKIASPDPRSYNYFGSNLSLGEINGAVTSHYSGWEGGGDVLIF